MEQIFQWVRKLFDWIGQLFGWNDKIAEGY